MHRICPLLMLWTAPPLRHRSAIGVVALKRARLKEVRPGNETAFEVLKELARTRQRNADKVDPGIGRTRLGQRTLKCVFLIGTRSANSIMASGFTAAQTDPMKVARAG